MKGHHQLLRLTLSNTEYNLKKFQQALYPSVTTFYPPVPKIVHMQQQTFPRTLYHPTQGGLFIPNLSIYKNIINYMINSLNKLV